MFRDVLWAAVVTAFFSIPLALSVWALLDAARRPRWAWSLAGRDQVWWMFGILCGVLMVPVGIAVSLWYLIKVRPVIAGAEHGRF